MIKKFVVVLIAIVGCYSYAQQGTASPYSFYGIGSLKFRGTVENRGMGGIGSYIDSLHINLRNPASYAGKNLKADPYNGESRPVKFSVAGSFSSIGLESNTESESAGTSTFDYIAVSIPLGRFGAGFGLLPFTSVGYKLQDINSAQNNRIDYRYEGEGGLNKAFFSLGYLVNDNISVGVDANYNFGNTQNSAIQFVYDSDGNIVQFATRENNRSDLSGLNFNIGAAYKGKINEKLELSATATYSPESSLNSINDRSISTLIVSTLGDEFVQNTIDVDLAASNLDETELDLPSRLSLGLGIGQTSKWFIGAEYVAQNTSVFNNPIFSTTNSSFEDASSFAIGGFYLPNHRSLSSYFKRVTYRAGARFENTGLVVNNESIDEFGISFGLGLPIGPQSGLFSEVNLGFEYGQRGTKNRDLIQEKFFNFNVSLSLSDRWFQKRKYN
ncbi:hypothetical protein BTO05_11050 [Winogradskyella sp. PC-19]|uniref:hypothetical protein n=1 Tax=unclassified Winogradskyella TaxID=2615021 RepID=UPI000B3BFF4E|nr:MULTISPECIES: hypothetical protein [unclassified Winogradskyella]ARV10147.1 hypothetical protein BTO05_11050 [Winogradskyella sp. PC-19]RZN82760.1 MAG: hypothetical protein EVB12_02490 [Winogradskyella sp.]